MALWNSIIIIKAIYWILIPLQLLCRGVGVKRKGGEQHATQVFFVLSFSADRKCFSWAAFIIDLRCYHRYLRWHRNVEESIRVIKSSIPSRTFTSLTSLTNTFRGKVSIDDLCKKYSIFFPMFVIIFFCYFNFISFRHACMCAVSHTPFRGHLGPIYISKKALFVPEDFLCFEAFLCHFESKAMLPWRWLFVK